jgi:hypothetical protein
MDGWLAAGAGGRMEGRMEVPTVVLGVPAYDGWLARADGRDAAERGGGEVPTAMRDVPARRGRMMVVAGAGEDG